ncbi:MAG TPA: hypothetical protein VGO52_20250 [Hyphomonadaceae bacterium]|jgi:hypothetical protein|nr:hypothetical protein [Hyphomonadaceae bacterium]
MRYRLMILAILSSVCATASADTFTKEEKALVRRVEEKLDAATLAQWALIFSPVLTGLPDGGEGALSALRDADWDKLGNASRNLKRITACKIVEEIDLFYAVDADEDGVSDVGRAYFRKVREEFDRSC